MSDNVVSLSGSFLHSVPPYLSSGVKESIFNMERLKKVDAKYEIFQILWTTISLNLLSKCLHVPISFIFPKKNEKKMFVDFRYGSQEWNSRNVTT